MASRFHRPVAIRVECKTFIGGHPGAGMIGGGELIGEIVRVSARAIGAHQRGEGKLRDVAGHVIRHAVVGIGGAGSIDRPAIEA